jgi:hypothetical protein
LGEWFLAATEVWLDLNFLRAGVPISPPAPEVELYTDASSKGWGGHADSLSVSGTWSPAESSLHINLLEMMAVSRSLKAFLAYLRNKSVLLFTDNTTVSFYLTKQGGARSQSLSLAAEEILLWCQNHGISLQARHIPGKLNILADSLSRSHCVLQTEWTLSPEVLKPVWQAWYRPMVDLFATRFNFRLPVYVSPVPDPQALAIDAFSIPWASVLGYAFPPLPVLSKVIRKAREEKAALILVAPFWPKQPWFPELMELCHEQPLALSLRPGWLRQPRSGICHQDPGLLNLHAWRLCGQHCAHLGPPTAL